MLQRLWKKNVKLLSANAVPLQRLAFCFIYILHNLTAVGGRGIYASTVMILTHITVHFVLKVSINLAICDNPEKKKNHLNIFLFSILILGQQSHQDFLLS